MRVLRSFDRSAIVAQLLPVAVVGVFFVACAGPDATGPRDGPILASDAHPGLSTLATRRGARLALWLPKSSIAHVPSGSWTLAKTGSVDAAAGAVTWQITASPGAAGGTSLIEVTGRVLVRNPSPVPATIGNVVVRLDRQDTKWIPVAYNVANATQGDAATSALIVDPTNDDADDDDDDTIPMKVDLINESSASGSLTFTQGASTPFSLVPKVTLPPGATLDLRFKATFNNSVLNIPVGKKVRANIKITSGNAGNGPKTVPNLDIDGSGSLSSDEARVRTKGRNLGQHTLGHPTNAPNTSAAAVVLSDTIDDITTTGTVTFSNAVFDLGATSGTVRVNYDGGDDGGTITNCAALTGTNVNLVACDTQDIEPDAPHVWADREVITYNQTQWGDITPAGSGLIMMGSFLAVYPTGNFTIGSTFNAIFASGVAVLDYLPAVGLPGAYTHNYFNPTSTSAGFFGGDVLALKLDVDYSSAGVIMGSLGVPFGSLRICNPPGLPLLHGASVSQFLDFAINLLGGGSGAYSINEIVTLTVELTNSFNGGVVSHFARDHLQLDECE